MTNDMLGGFFYALGIKTDGASFQKAENALKGMAQTTGKLTAAIGITGGSMLAMAKAAGVMETANLKTARAIGVSSAALDQWKISAGVAGTNASALVSGMAQVEKKMQGLKLGRVDTGLAQNLAQLGLGYGAFSNMDATQRMRAVFSAAGGMKDQQKAALLVSETLGQGAHDFYDYMQLSGRSMDSILAEGRRLTFQTEASKRSAMMFNAEFNGLTGGLKSMAAFAGGAFGQAFTPAVREIKNLLAANREMIQSGIQGFAQNMAQTVIKITGAVAKLAPIVGRLVNRFGGLDKILIKIGMGVAALKLARLAGGIAGIVKSVGLLKTGLTGLGAGLGLGALYLLIDDLMVYFAGGNSVTGYIIRHLDEIKKKLKIDISYDALVKSVKDLAKGFKDLWESIDGNSKLMDLGSWLSNYLITSLTDTLTILKDIVNVGAKLIDGDWKGAWQASKELGSDMVTGAKHAAGKMNDGIIRPNGQVTQVAPDDWVFAARNLGDLASAFIPGGVTNSMNAPASYVINQSFTFNGNATPQAVRQRAYSGAQDALQNSLRNSQRMLQLMPGTR